MDSWDPAAPHPDKSGIPPLITYRDMREIMKSRIPVRQTASYQASLAVYPPDPDIRPSREAVRMAFSDFFPMFDVPFRFGSGWDRAADVKPEAVVVISSALNDRLFGGANSVGKTLRIEDREFRVAGVLAPWRPRVRFYDLSGFSLAEPEAVFLPFGWVEPMEIRPVGRFDGWKALEGNPTFVERAYASESVFLQMWVELHDAAQVRAYHDFLDAYAREQTKFGRFQRPLDNRVTPLRELMAEYEVTPPQSKAIATISILFLSVAALNLIGLFLGKFLARAPVVGIRRALGASRASIFFEHLIECELVGLIGGGLGLLVSLGVLAFFNRVLGRMVQMEGFFQLDAAMILAAVLLSLVAGAIAGIYPSWRICSIPPARHLKNM
jgi:putative ABC transport system permease protein